MRLYERVRTSVCLFVCQSIGTMFAVCQFNEKLYVGTSVGWSLARSVFHRWISLETVNYYIPKPLRIHHHTTAITQLLAPPHPLLCHRHCHHPFSATATITKKTLLFLLVYLVLRQLMDIKHFIYFIKLCKYFQEKAKGHIWMKAQKFAYKKADTLH